MPAKRGPKTKGAIVDAILALKKNDPDNQLTARRIRGLLKPRFKESLLPKERAIYNILRKNKERTVFNEIDRPWSLASLGQYPIAPEYVADILALSKVFKRGEPFGDLVFSVRQALWAARLCKLVAEIDKKSNRRLYRAKLGLISQLYATQEQMREIWGCPLVDSREMDAAVFGNPDFWKMDGFEKFGAVMEIVSKSYFSNTRNEEKGESQ